MDNPIKHIATTEIVCPHCGYVIHPSHHHIRDGVTRGVDLCDECSEEFRWRAHIKYSTEKLGERNATTEQKPRPCEAVMRHWRVEVHTVRGPAVRFYRGRTSSKAQRQAANEQDVIRTGSVDEISEEEFKRAE